MGFVLVAFLAFVSAWDVTDERDRWACQAHTRNPLDGCDGSKTVFVGADSRFRTVQSGEEFSWVYIEIVC